MRTAGRPKGSKNKLYVPTEQQPAKCPVCGGTELKQLKGTSPIIRRYHGPEYDRVVIRRAQCACGQHCLIRTYEKDSPAK